MKISCMPLEALPDELIARWDELQQSNAAYDSPFFSPHFTLAVAKARPDVRVTVLEEDGQWGFFPFQANKWGCGSAVGWRVNDFQGAVVSGGMLLDGGRLLAASGLRSWCFDHLICQDSLADATRLGQSPSPYIDLRDGFAAYCEGRNAAGSDAIKQTLRKERKLSREVGQVCLESHSNSDAVMLQLASWKTEQLRRSGSLSILEVEWIQKVIRRLRQSSEDGCQGDLCALYAGDQLVAAHFGLRSRAVLHWWITAYNPAYEHYSPGAILLLCLAKAAAGEGVRRIDLGKGGENYKQRFMNGSTQVSEGTLTTSAIYRGWRRALYRAREIARTSAMRGAVRHAKRVLRSSPFRSGVA